MEEFVGKYISLNCGESLGIFQGQILHVDSLTQKITLQKVFHNGRPYASSQVVISAEDIQNLQIIEGPSDVNQQNTVKIKKPVAKKALDSADSSSTSKNTEINESPRKEVMRTPSKKEKCRVRGWKDEAAFGSPIDQHMMADFDFEKNLALFNKKAFYEEMQACKPDVVRQADKRNSKYRCDENVLSSTPATYRQMTVPEPSHVEYVTDEGLVVPSLTLELRRKLFAAAEESGMTLHRQSEMVGRAATEMALLLLGGAHRLNPQNHHQCPSVTVLCGTHHTGLQAVSAARHMASHGVRTTVFLQGPHNFTPEMYQELSLYRLTNNRVTASLQDLCTSPVDLIILALIDCHSDTRSNVLDAARWANENRAQVLALNPPAQGTPGVTSKYALVPGLPLAYDQCNGKIYLCNIGMPLQVFKDVGIKYVAPFGPKFVLPLYPNDM